MKKKTFAKIAAIVLGIVVGISAVGCTDSGRSDGRVKLYVADKITDATGLNSWIKERQEAFDEEFGDEIEVIHLPGPAGSTDQVQAVMQQFTDAVDAPALSQVNSINTNRTLWASGILGDWSEYLTDWDGYANFTDAMKESYLRGDSIIGFPISMEIPLLGYSKTHLTDAGYMSADGVPTAEFLEKSQTWSGYSEIAKNLTDASTAGQEVSGSSMLLSDYYLFFANWLKANGDKMASEDEKGKITLDFDNDNAVETIKFIRSLYNGENKSIYHSLNAELGDFMSLIWDGKIASFTFYPTWAEWFQSVNYDIENIYVTLFPKNENREDEYTTAFYSTSYVLNGKKPKAEQAAAAEYVKFMCSEEAWLDRIEFADSYEIMQVVFPPYKTIGIDDMTDMLPNNWKEVTQQAMAQGEISKLSVDNYTTYLQAELVDLVSTPGLTDDQIKATLNEAQTTAENEWLNRYNEDKE